MAPTSDLFLVGLIRGLQQALQANDYGLLILGPGDLLKRWVDSRAVDGVIVVGGSDDDAEAARAIVRPEVPCIVIGTSPLEAEPHIGSVVIDLAGGGVKVARQLYESGHRRIGFIGSSYYQSVLPAFQNELESLGAPLRPEWSIIAGDTSDDGERAMRELLSLPTPPTAVFTRTDELAIGALRAARKMGVEVPRQLSIIGHDDLAFARFVEPPLSTVRIDCDAVGKAVVAMLFDLLEHPDISYEARAVATQIVLRETLAPPEL
ncbi:LacI family transcriptional regulator [bacterium]|nr:MAG: LacI family transcriptional regulator [bacterium]